jgi:hypothetical protein
MSPRLRALRLSFCLIAASLLAACGGGGGGGGAALPPAPPASPGGPAAGGPSTAPAAVDLSIAIPAGTTASAAGRRPRYVSAATKSVTVSFGTSQQSADCTATCSMTLQVLPGTVTFNVALYDAFGGKGNVLSTGQTTTTIAAGVQNRVALVFGGVVAALAVSLIPGSVPAGTPAAVPISVQAKDAAGYTIVGPDAFATPVQLSNDDTSGATSLSATTITSASDKIALNYNGSGNATVAHVTASVPSSGVRSQPAALTVQAPAGPPPPATGPAHIATWYFYSDNDNQSVPMAWMGKHADYIENDGDRAAAFKAAGGKYVARYTDPAYVPYCQPPFTPPAKGCIGSIGVRVKDESGWLHGPDGARVHHFYNAEIGYQEALNPASPLAREAYRQDTQATIDATPQVDYFFADDTGGTFLGGDGTQMSGHMYGFNAPSVEITTDAQWLAALPGMLAAAVRPVIINGVDGRTQMPSYNGALLDAPNVAGETYEGCNSWNGGVAGDQGNRWNDEQNSMLMTIRHHSLALCMMTIAPTPSNRLYEMASLWMTYHEKYTVAAPVAKFADATAVVPEYDIVPRQPLRTAVNDVSELRSSTGAFVREFAACYQGGTSIGPCAAIVNPTGSPVALPALSGRYASSLVLNAASAVGGGTATWSGGVPAQIPSLGAVVLR